MATVDSASGSKVNHAVLQSFMHGSEKVLKHIEPACQEIGQFQTVMTSTDEENARKLQHLENEVEVVNKNNQQLADEREEMRKKLLQLEKEIANAQTDLQLANDALKRERQSMSNTCGQVSDEVSEQHSATVAALNDKIQVLETKVNEKDKHIIEIERASDEKLQDAASQTEDLKKKLSISKAKAEQLKTELGQQKKEATEIREKKDQTIVEMEARFNKTLNEAIYSQKELETMLSDSQATVGEQERGIKELEKQMRECNRQLKDKDAELKVLADKLKQLENENECLQKSNDESKTRLGGLLAKKLHACNPDIANLAEENRPTRVAELYSELYDNQWTEAYEVSEQMFPDNPESEQIKMLGRILMTTYQFCRKESTEQKGELSRALTRSTQENDIEVPSSTRQTLDECRRELANLAVDSLYEKFSTKPGSKIKGDLKKFIEATPKYVKECIRVCWLMALQNPPNVVQEFTPNTPFDSKIYQVYTSGGDMMEFLAWPALLLHVNGPVLAKGVAQCYKSKDRKEQKVPTMTAASSKNPANGRVTDAGKDANDVRTEAQGEPSIESNSVPPSDGETTTDTESPVVAKDQSEAKSDNQTKTDAGANITKAPKSNETSSNDSKDNDNPPNVDTTVHGEQDHHVKGGKQERSTEDQSADGGTEKQFECRNDLDAEEGKQPVVEKSKCTKPDQEVNGGATGGEIVDCNIKLNKNADLDMGIAYPPELIPTKKELRNYKYWTQNNSESIAKHQVGEELYCKCQKYLQWKDRQDK